MAHHNVQQSPPLVSMPLEVLSNIFAQVRQIKHKMRLERVCKRFQQCLQLPQSWRFNTTLYITGTSTLPFTLAKLKHVAEFRVLQFSMPNSHVDLDTFVEEMRAQSHKFKLRELEVSDGNKSKTFERFLLKAASIFAPHIERLDLRNYHKGSVVARLIQNSRRLECVRLDMTGYRKYTNVLSALRDKPLKCLELASWIRPPLDARLLATAINSVLGQTLNELRLIDCFANEDLPDFLLQLSPAAGQAITHLSFQLRGFGPDRMVLQLMRDAPVHLPNLKKIAFKIISPINGSSHKVYVYAIHQFLEWAKSNQARASPIEMHLFIRALTNTLSFVMSHSWWEKMDLMIACRLGENLQAHPINHNNWQRIIVEPNARVVVTYEKNN